MAVSNSVDRFNGVVVSKAIKVPCAVATSANISLAGSQLIDGVTVVTDDRVLVRAQTNAVENGIYNVKANAWERAADWDGNRDITRGTTIIAHDSLGAPVNYIVTTLDPIFVNTTAVAIELFNVSGGVVIPAGTITDAMLRWDGVDTYRETDRVRATANGANFMIYDVGLTEFMDVSYVGTSAIFALNTGGHNFRFDNEVILNAADLQMLGGDIKLLDDDQILIGTQAGGEIGIRFDGDQRLEIYDISATNTRVSVLGMDYFVNIEGNSNSFLGIGETTTLRGDLQRSILSMTGENSGVIQIAQISNRGDLWWFNGASLPIQIDGATGSPMELNVDSIKLLEATAAPADELTYGQFWVRDDAPNTPMFTDDSGVDYELNAASLQFDVTEWAFDTATGMADPGAGEVRFNNATPASITQFAFNDVDANGNDHNSVLFPNVTAGDTIRVKDTDDITVDLQFSVTNTAEGGGWWRIDVSHIAGTVLPSSLDNLQIEISPIPAFEKGTQDGQVASWNGTDFRWENNVNMRADVPAGGEARMVTGLSVFRIESASRIQMNQALFASYTSNTDALIMGADGGMYSLGTGSTSNKNLDLWADAGGQAVRVKGGSTLMIGERTESLADITGYGQIWVDSDDDTLNYTTQAGAHTIIGGVGAGNPFDGPLRILGDINTATPPTTELITAQLEFADLANNDFIANLGFSGTNTMRLKNLMHGGNIEITGEDGSGTDQFLITMDPDGPVDFYHGGVKRGSIESDSIAVYSTTSTDAETRIVRFKHQDDTDRGFIGHAGDDIMLIANQIHGGNVLLRGEDGAGALHSILDGDPDGATTLYYDGAAMLATSAEGFQTTGNFLITSAIPLLKLYETGVSADEGRYDVRVQTGNLNLRTRTDADGAGVTIFTVNRGTGTAVDNMTFAVPLVMSDELVSRAILIDYCIASDSNVISGNAATLSFASGPTFELDLDAATGNVTVTLSGGPPSGNHGQITVKIIQDSTNRTITWAGGAFVWRDGAAHVMQTGNDAVSIYTFETWDGGTTWYGAGADYS